MTQCQMSVSGSYEHLVLFFFTVIFVNPGETIRNDSTGKK